LSVNKLISGRNKIISRAGETLRIRYFSVTVGSVWDDEGDAALAISGVDTWGSGVVLPVSLNRGSSDSVLVEQGNLIPADKKVFMNGSILLTGSDLALKIQIGSPNGDDYEYIQPGGITNAFSDTDIYKKFYLRYLPTGSLTGE